MRLTLAAFGSGTIAGYAVLGAFLMNDWAIVAASELPLSTTIDEMAAAGQPYSSLAGVMFAALGITLALGWAVLTVHPRVGLPVWGSLAAWAGIVALGAPAYFAGAFGNLNSVGDTFWDWNAAAAWRIEAPLYFVSAAAFVLALGILATVATSAVKRSRALSYP